MTLATEWGLVLDVRTYTLGPGRRDEFDRIFRAEALPLLARHDIRVVAFGPSVVDETGYTLVMLRHSRNAKRSSRLLPKRRVAAAVRRACACTDRDVSGRGAGALSGAERATSPLAVTRRIAKWEPLIPAPLVTSMRIAEPREGRRALPASGRRRPSRLCARTAPAPVRAPQRLLQSGRQARALRRDR
jgi:hypothetical protein